jgi:tRNA threonylcarbamoyl adenosine modification protein (Sua5/YciO/YrdC/YwlC family)
MAEFVKIYPENPNEKAIAKVVDVLKNGGVIIYPTDTVYAMGCDITNNKALEKLARLKGIKLQKNRWSFVCEDFSHLSDYVKQMDGSTFKLIKRALPGPYTFILPGSNNLPKNFKNRKTVGIRISSNSIVQAILKKLGNPIVTTSIYDQDEIIEYTTDPEIIYDNYKNQVDLIIDGGFGGNIPSTIVDLTTYEPEVIREGKGDINSIL